MSPIKMSVSNKTPLHKINQVGSPTPEMIKKYPRAFLLESELPNGVNRHNYHYAFAMTPEGRFVPKSFFTEHPEEAVKLIYPSEILQYVDHLASIKDKRVKTFLNAITKHFTANDPLKKKENDSTFNLDLRDRDQFLNFFMGRIATIIAAVLHDLENGDEMVPGYADPGNYPFLSSGQKTTSLVQIALSAARRDILHYFEAKNG